MNWALVALMLLAAPLAACGGYDSSYTTGKIIKLSQASLFCTRWEGQMDLGSVVPNIWEFTVKDPATAKEIQKAMVAGQPVTVRYRPEIFTWPWCRSPSDNIVLGVEH